MKSYKSLRTVARFFEILAWFQLILGLLLALIFLTSFIIIGDQAINIMAGLGFALLSVVSFVACMAITQLIRLFVNSADNIQNLTDNVYVIASRESENKDNSLLNWLKANPTKGINDYYSEAK